MHFFHNMIGLGVLMVMTFASLRFLPEERHRLAENVARYLFHDSGARDQRRMAKHLKMDAKRTEDTR
jgi:hypothetical protein